MKPKEFLYKAARRLWLHGWLYRVTPGRHRRLVQAIAQRAHATVVFLPMNVAMWRYQGIYDLLQADPRFTVHIVLSPSIEAVPAQQLREMQQLRDHFNALHIPFIDWNPDCPASLDALDPDVIFYTQPYEHLLTPAHDCMRHYSRLECYVPYAFWTGKGKYSYDLHFHNLAWRLYYSTPDHLALARETAWNHGRNVRVVGYPNADDFLRGHFSDPWKPMPDGKHRLRLIWAPHHTINGGAGFILRANILWMAPLMLRIAHDYADRLQIAFKPHPRLYTVLCNQPGWGKEKTDAFYRQWATMPNTQLETGSYVDLFMTSDAMLHDCGSFSIEYHYSLKPVMFVSTNMQEFLKSESDFARAAYAVHYIGKDEAQILDFINRVVLGGNDPMLPQRQAFFNRYLLPPGGKTVAQNIYDDLTQSLFQH